MNVVFQYISNLHPAELEQATSAKEINKISTRERKLNVTMLENAELVGHLTENYSFSKSIQVLTNDDDKVLASFYSNQR